jgi:hypothetical protein
VPPPRGAGEGEGVGRLARHDPGEYPAVGQGEGGTAVALDDLGGRVEDRLNQVGAVELPADVRRVGADAPAGGPDLVAGAAPGPGRVEEDRPTGRRVAAAGEGGLGDPGV